MSNNEHASWLRRFGFFYALSAIILQYRTNIPAAVIWHIYYATIHSSTTSTESVSGFPAARGGVRSLTRRKYLVLRNRFEIFEGSGEQSFLRGVG